MITHLKGTVPVILHILRVTHLLEKEQGIAHLDIQVMKFLKSEEMPLEEFLDDNSRPKRKYIYFHALF